MVGGSSGTPVRLAVGPVGTVLSSYGSEAQWRTINYTDITGNVSINSPLKMYQGKAIASKLDTSDIQAFGKAPRSVLYIGTDESVQTTLDVEIKPTSGGALKLGNFMDANYKLIKHVLNPVDKEDAANKQYVDSMSHASVTVSGDIISTILQDGKYVFNNKSLDAKSQIPGATDHLGYASRPQLFGLIVYRFTNLYPDQSNSNAIYIATELTTGKQFIRRHLYGAGEWGGWELKNYD